MQGNIQYSVESVCDSVKYILIGKTLEKTSKTSEIKSKGFEEMFRFFFLSLKPSHLQHSRGKSSNYFCRRGEVPCINKALFSFAIKLSTLKLLNSDLLVNMGTDHLHPGNHLITSLRARPQTIECYFWKNSILILD